MTLSRRETMLLALLPPLVVVAVYVWFMRPGSEERLSRAVAVATAGTEGERLAVADARALDGLRDQYDATVTARAALAERAASLKKAWCQPAGRAAAVEEMNLVFRRCGLRVVRSEAATDDADDARVSTFHQDLARAMKDLGGDPPLMWRFEVRGDYPRLLAALDGAANGVHFHLPITMNADHLDGADDLGITLWFWI